MQSARRGPVGFFRARIAVAIALAAHGAVAAAKPPEPLPYPLAPELAVELYLTQTELTPVSGVSSPVVDPVMMNGLVANHGTAGLVGGLIGGLIVGAIIQKGANDGAKWGNGVIGPYDYRTSMEASLRAALVSDGITPSPIIKLVLPEPKPEPGATEFKPAPVSKGPVACTNPVLRLRPLRWAPVNSTLVTGLNASFYDCVPGKKGGLEEKLAWSRGYQVSMVADAEAMPRKQQKGYIEGLDEARVHQLLDHAAAEVAAMFAYEFTQEGRVEREQKVSLWNGFRQIRAGEHWAWNRHHHAMMPNILGTYRLSDASLVAFSAAAAAPAAAVAAPATPVVGEAVAGPAAAVAPTVPANAAPAPAGAVAPAAPLVPAAPAPAAPEASGPATGGDAVQAG
ncbi:hypothetical protein [Lysobacter antibioticus]|nr:hypothetical protein [Lysobacter antibioticus]